MIEKQTIKQGLDRISKWAEIYYSGDDKKIVSGMTKAEIDENIKISPFKLPKEAYEFYENGHTSIYFSPVPNQFISLRDLCCFSCGVLSQAAKDAFTSLDSHSLNLYEIFPEDRYCDDSWTTPDWCEVNIAYGSGKELYSVRCYKYESDFSPVWVRGVGATPYIYASGLTNLILATADCYDAGAYYPVLLEHDGYEDFYAIEVDWNKAESICRKYNPNQIDKWRNNLEE